MSENSPFVSIILPVFNEEINLLECLTSLVRLDYPDSRFEIIVVDNGSTDNSLKIAKQFPVTILQKLNVKVGGVRNYGVAHSNGEIVVFLDSDCTVESWWLKEGVKRIKGDGYDAVGGLVLLRDNPSWIERNWILKSSRSFVYQNTFVGACIFIRKNVFQSVGGFSESLNAGEDCYLTEQLVEHGYKIKIDAELSVVHLGYPSTLLGFIRRQIWHSSDSILRLNTIFSDKTLLLVVLFIASFAVLLITSTGVVGEMVPLYSLVVWAALPALLSVKRILRYGAMEKLPSIVSIYLVDVLYLTARSIGLIRGGVNILFFDGRSKVYK